MGTRAVTFDLDDTLAVVDRPRAEILAEAVDAVGGPVLTREDYLDAHASVWSSQTREPIFASLLAKEGDIVTDPSRLADAYRRAIGDSLRPVAGVEAMLARLRDSVKVGLITNGPTEAQRDKLDRLGWVDRFDAVVISGRVGAPKPQPEPFMTACDRLNVEPSDVLHVGDHQVHDVKGARDAGLDAIQVVANDTTSATEIDTVPRHRLATDLPQLAIPAVH